MQHYCALDRFAGSAAFRFPGPPLDLLLELADLPQSFGADKINSRLPSRVLVPLPGDAELLLPFDGLPCEMLTMPC